MPAPWRAICASNGARPDARSLPDSGCRCFDRIPIMTITDVRTILLTGPCTNDPFLSEARKRRSAAFIEVITDGRHIGIGERSVQSK
jgi:hypothetical protein